jgi:hypothetical protein
MSSIRDASKGEMNVQTRSRLDRDTAEDLLNGGQAGAYTGHRLLAALLAAAGGPVRPVELAGEQTLLAALRITLSSPAYEPRRSSMIKTAVMKLLTVKVGVAVATATAAGGLATAAATGNLPATLTGSDQAGPGTATDGWHAGGKLSPAPSASKGKDQEDPRGPQGSPSPSLVGLCHAVSAGNKTEHGKALQNPAFTSLITAAGGPDKVAAFCSALLSSPSAEPKAGPPADTGRNPSKQPDERATGAPRDHPTGKPTTKSRS